MKHHVLAGLLTAGFLLGCAWGPGTGYATVEGAPVTFQLPLGTGRLDAAGRWKTSNGYLVRVSDNVVRLELGNLALQAPGQAGTAAQGGTFDPANPPPRYSNCHSGHCHRDDGALIDYEDIQAEMSQGGAAAAPSTVIALQPSAAEVAVPLGNEAAVTFGGCQPDCFLEQGTVDRAAIALKRLRISGQVEAAPGTAALGAQTRMWQLDLPLSASIRPAQVKATISRQGPSMLRLGGRLTLSDKLLDGIEWERLASQPGTINLAADAKTLETLIANMAGSEWAAQLAPAP
jgi:hypothetical protein